MYDLSEVHIARLRGGPPPAVLLGGINVLRAIGRGGIPVIAASTERDSLAFASRYCRARVLLPPLDQPDALERLARLGERLAGAFGRPVPLFYGDDDYLNLILQHRERLARCYAFTLNDPGVAGALIDKERFGAFARSRGLPLPRSYEWDELSGVAQPVLVKPRLKVAFENSAFYSRLLGGGGKARIFPSGREIALHPVARALRDDLVFQDYIPGDDRQIWSFHGYADEAGRLLACFTGRKIRTHPPLTGLSTYLQLEYNHELAAIGREIVERAPLKGVFKIDLKHDPRDGRFVMLEINARFNLWHHLAAANGLNLPRVAYDYLLEGKRPPAMPAFRTDVRWLNLPLDYRAYRGLAARGELGFWRWLVSLRTRKVYQVFAWNDPVPLARYWIGRVLRVRRATVRLTRWLFTAS